MSVNKVMQEEHQQDKHPGGMQFTSRMTQMGEYFYIRIPTERGDAAAKFKGKTLLVRFKELKEEELPI